MVLVSRVFKFFSLHASVPSAPHMAAVCILKSFSVQENGLVALYEVWSFLILQINDVQTLLLAFFFLSNAFKALASSLCRLWRSLRLPTNFHSESYTGPRQSPSAGVHLPPSLLRGLPSESAIHPGTWNLCGESYRFCFLKNHKQGWPSFGGFLFPRFHQSFPVGNCVTTPVPAPREKRFKDMTSVSDF